MPHRACTKCGSVKPETLEFFKAHKDCRAGLDTTCRECANAYSRSYKAARRDDLSARRRAQYAQDNGEKNKAREWARAAREPLQYSARNLMSGVRGRAREAGYEVAAELRDGAFIERWLQRQPNCESCNSRMEIGRKAAGMKTDLSPSFDRFDLSEGYTLANTALVCWRCNNIKRNYTASDLRMVAEWIDRRVWGNQTDKFKEDAA